MARETFIFPRLISDPAPTLSADLNGQSAYSLLNMVDGTFSGALAAGSLDVDTLSLNGNVISDSTGKISFSDDILQTGNAIYLTQADGAERIDSDGFVDIYAGTRIDLNQNTRIGGSMECTRTIKTGSPAEGTAAPWKLGSYQVEEDLVGTGYLEAQVDDTIYKILAIEGDV